MNNFNKILGVILILFFSFLTINQNSFAITEKTNDKKVLVLSDRLEQANVKYFIYPQVSEIVSQETINRLNLDGDVKALQLSDVRTELRSAELSRNAATLLNNYRYTYDINYAALRKIAKHFNVSNVLLVTGALDTTSDFLKPTWWAFLNIPGENVVKSEFKIYTYAALVDLNKNVVTWQNAYERKLVAPEFGMTNLNYSPDAKQMTKVQKGSQLIAKDIAYRVESVLTPLIAAEKKPPTIHEFVKLKINKTYEESAQNINELKAKTVEKIKNLNQPDTNNIIPAVEKTNKTKEEIIEAKPISIIEEPKVEENIQLTTNIKTEKNNVKKENENKNTDTLNFVNQKNDKKEKIKKIKNKTQKNKKQNLLESTTIKESEYIDLRPAIDVEKNIQINPINIIIPKI